MATSTPGSLKEFQQGIQKLVEDGDHQGVLDYSGAHLFRFEGEMSPSELDAIECGALEYAAMALAMKAHAQR